MKPPARGTDQRRKCIDVRRFQLAHLAILEQALDDFVVRGQGQKRLLVGCVLAGLGLLRAVALGDRAVDSVAGGARSAAALPRPVNDSLRIVFLGCGYITGVHSAHLRSLRRLFTPGYASRDRAKALGFALHLVNGWIFALIYVAAFNSWGRSTWWLGALIGLVHGLFVLTAGMRLIPGIHPRMASESQGPDVVRQLEPPGFLALNYGVQTPISVIVAHIVFGAILGAFYTAAAS